jgi:hypothetical protein
MVGIEGSDGCDEVVGVCCQRKTMVRVSSVLVVYTSLFFGDGAL